MNEEEYTAKLAELANHSKHMLLHKFDKYIIPIIANTGYAGDIFAPSLYKTQPNEISQTYRDVLDFSLDKLSPYTLSRPIVYRICQSSLTWDIARFWFAKFQDKTILFPAALPTFKEYSDMPETRDFYYKIHLDGNNTYARDVSHLGKKSEREVLFKSRTCFKIGSINYNKKSIELFETQNKPDLIIKECFWLNHPCE